MLQILHAGAHSGLGDMQPAGGFQETAIGRYGEKSSYLFQVHGF
jgi:hypothetical protein